MRVLQGVLRGYFEGSSGTPRGTLRGTLRGIPRSSSGAYGRRAARSCREGPIGDFSQGYSNGVLEGYSTGYSMEYSNGTRMVLEWYSRGTRMVLDDVCAVEIRPPSRDTLSEGYSEEYSEGVLSRVLGWGTLRGTLLGTLPCRSARSACGCCTSRRRWSARGSDSPMVRLAEYPSEYPLGYLTYSTLRVSRT